MNLGDLPKIDLGACNICRKSLNLPLCAGPDPEYHDSARSAMMSRRLSRIQQDITLVNFLRKCEVDYAYAKSGHPSPWNTPTFQSEPK